jgi:hypothetical protein
MKTEERFDINDLRHFTEKQREASRAVKKYKFVLYGGAMGGGKSYFLRWKLLSMLLAYAARGLLHVTVGLFCEDYPSLKDRHLSKIKYEFPDWLGEYNASDHNFTLKPEFGSGVIAFRNLDDASKYQSSEFGVIAVDELTKNTEETFMFLRTRLRWPGIPDTKFIGATNPGGVGHDWVKKHWIEHVFPENEKEADQFLYIQALVKDNPHIDQSYLKTLESLPERKRKAFLQGDWDIFEGQYFTEWDKAQHVVKSFPIPDGWKKFRAYDHGRENPACCKWYAVDYDGNVWVYRELYVRGRNADEIASEIARLSGNEVYFYSVADPSIFARTGFVDQAGGETIAEIFWRKGIAFIPASNRRIDGWNIMHQYLAWKPYVPPKLKYFENCINSIRTIPALIHDEINPEDLDTRGEDHAADCDRYLLISLHEFRTPPPLNEVERKLKEIREGQWRKPWDLYG